jgi:NAD+ synthase (glutamine-hydrolysing)
LKDVPKTLVYRIAHWRNRRDATPVIPARALRRAPTAELKRGQKDSDSLPPYPVLDPILKAYVEDGRSVREIARMGFSAAAVGKVARMVERSEYKRRQSPPGVKILAKAFGKDRRNPITHGFKPWEGF